MGVNRLAKICEIEVGPQFGMIERVEGGLSTSAIVEFEADLVIMPLTGFEVNVRAAAPTKPGTVLPAKSNSLEVATSCFDADLLVVVIMGFEVDDCAVVIAGVQVESFEVVSSGVGGSSLDVIIAVDVEVGLDGIATVGT